jgi:hypothetical protein
MSPIEFGGRQAAKKFCVFGKTEGLFSYDIRSLEQAQRPIADYPFLQSKPSPRKLKKIDAGAVPTPICRQGVFPMTTKSGLDQ